MPNVNVVGIDGFSPVYDPEGLWRIWSLAQIWRGVETAGENRWVARVDDYVRDPKTYETWIVDFVDPITLVPTLRKIYPEGVRGVYTEDDLLFGVGPGAEPATYRAFLNDAVFPHTLCVEQRIKVNGTLSSYAKIFLGIDVTAETGKVISKVYDASGNFVSTAVPLELVALDSHVNYAVKGVKRCHVTEKFVNNTELTIVFYADDGHVVEKRRLLVENTDTFADASLATKYILDISLESVWLSPTATDTLEFPLNVPMDAMNLIGIVHYSDGSTLRLPVGNGKFEMLGLEGRLSTIIGQPHELVLRYTLSQGELAFASTGVNGSFITKPYKIVTVNPNHSVAVKLFGYPFWDSALVGYRLRWWLLNLDRNVYFEATQHVRFAENTGPYDPLLYGYLQRKSVSVNLRDVSASFIPYIHTQVVDIVLNGPPSVDTQPSWTMANESSENLPRFGAVVYAERISDKKINLKASHATYDDWLTHFYRQTYPLYDREKEHEAPAPTHFIVTYGNTETIWPMSAWNQDIAIGVGVTSNQTVSIRFIKRLVAGDLNLSYAAAIIKTLF